MGVGCPYLLGIRPRQCSYRALLPKTSGNKYIILFPCQITGACVLCILLTSNKQVCIAPKVKNTVKYVHRPNAVFVEQAIQ